jgi:hypothetical protein
MIETYEELNELLDAGAIHEVEIPLDDEQYYEQNDG